MSRSLSSDGLGRIFHSGSAVPPSALLALVGVVLLTSLWVVADLPLAIALLPALVLFVPFLGNAGAVCYGLLALMFVQPIVFRLLPETHPVGQGFKYADEAALVVLLPFALFVHLSRRSLPVPRATAKALAWMFGIGVLGALLQRTPWFVATLDAFLLMKGFIIYALITALRPSRQVVAGIGRIWFAIAVVAALVGLLEIVQPGLVRGLLPTERRGMRLGMTTMISVFRNEGDAGWFFSFSAICALTLYTIYRRLPHLFLFCLFGLCCGLTLRRKAILGLLVALLLSLVLHEKAATRYRNLAVLACIVALVFVTFGGPLISIFVEGYDIYVGAREPWRIARNAMYLTAFQLAVDHFPIGVGFGLFGGHASQRYYSEIYYEYGLSTVHGLRPHDNTFMLDAFWPHVLGQFGFFGLGCFLFALGKVWHPMWLAVRRGSSPRWVLVLVWATTLTFVEGLVESAALPLFESTLSAFTLFGLAGLARVAMDREDPALWNPESGPLG